MAVFQTHFPQIVVFTLFHCLRKQQESQQLLFTLLSVPPLTDFAPHFHRANTASP